MSSADALEFAAALKEESVDLAFLDPPFNLGKEYDRVSELETLEPEEYEAYLRNLIELLTTSLKPGAALFLYHLPFWASKLSSILHQKLEFRHWIAVMMKNGFVRGKRLYPAHYALLYFTKGQPNVFNRPRLQPVECRHCGSLVKDYGGYTNIILEKGVNLSDFWDDLSPVRHGSKKHRAANQLPQMLTDRVVSIAGLPGGVLVDPFVGTGTSLVSAMNAGMYFAGNDFSRKSIATCKRRLEHEVSVSQCHHSAEEARQ